MAEECCRLVREGNILSPTLLELTENTDKIQLAGKPHNNILEFVQSFKAQDFTYDHVSEIFLLD